MPDNVKLKWSLTSPGHYVGTRDLPNDWETSERWCVDRIISDNPEDAAYWLVTRIDMMNEVEPEELGGYVILADAKEVCEHDARHPDYGTTEWEAKWCVGGGKAPVRHLRLADASDIDVDSELTPSGESEAQAEFDALAAKLAAAHTQMVVSLSPETRLALVMEQLDREQRKAVYEYALGIFNRNLQESL